MSIIQLKQLKTEFDKEYGNEYFSFIAPYYYSEWSQIKYMSQIYVNKTQIPEEILFMFKRLDLWIVKQDKLKNIYNGNPSLGGFIRYEDFIKI